MLCHAFGRGVRPCQGWRWSRPPSMSSSVSSVKPPMQVPSTTICGTVRAPLVTTANSFMASRSRSMRTSSKPIPRLSRKALALTQMGQVPVLYTLTAFMVGSCCKRLFQIEHVAHVIQAGRTTLQPFCGAQRTLSEGGAAAGLVGQLHTFADAGKQQRVVADDIAAAHGGKADGFGVTLAGDTFASVNG